MSELRTCFNGHFEMPSLRIQDNIGELDTDRQDELKRARRREEEEEEKGRKSTLLFGSEDTFDSIIGVEEKVRSSSLILLRCPQRLNCPC